MGRAENAVEKYLHDEVIKRGGTTRKWVSPGRRGVMDRIVLLPQCHVLFVEVKTLGEGLEDHQKREADALRSVGANVEVTWVSGKAGVDALLAGYL